MKDFPEALLARMRRGVTTICTCMSVLRRDGTSFCFTDHDEEITFAGQKYVPYNSFSRTSISTTLDLEVDTMEIRGILNSTAVARADIASGKFDFSEVETFVLDYEQPDCGRGVLRVGWLGEVVMNEDGTFGAEVRGLTQVLGYRIGEAYTPECRADLGDSRCKVALDPQPWEPKRLYQQGEAVKGHLNAAQHYGNLTFDNGSFEEDAPNTEARAPTGWTGYGPENARFTTVTTAPNMTPKVGSQFLVSTHDGSGAQESGCYQTLDLEDQSIDLTAIDTGLSRLHANVWMATLNGKARAQFRVFAIGQFDGLTQSEVVIYDSGQRAGSEDHWFLDDGCVDKPIPANTRKLKFDLHAFKRNSSAQGAAFDQITAAINYPEGNYGNQYEFGDVVFVAQNAGTSGATEPAFTDLIGGLTVDNTITWKAILSWAKVDIVRAPAADNLSFAPTALGQVSGYFEGGLLTWETGKNAGRSQEIKTYSPSKLVLFQRPFYPIQPGDRYVARPGCDKRIATCADKFDNAINFRGEPHVPGQDEYYATPNSQAG